ncbi:MAG: N4-gp56 family major capsid protein [Actinomycetes bacterium]
MAGSAVTGTQALATAPTAYSGSNSQLSQAIQTIWSKEILFQAMPILRFEQFAVKKTELGVSPGLRVNFLRYKNFTVDATPLTEGVRMTTNALTAEQIAITVAEHGYAVAVSELLLNASFDDIMASASRLLGRHMAQYLDVQARDTLSAATSATFGYNRSNLTASTTFNTYAEGEVGTSIGSLDGDHKLTTGAIKDSALVLASKNIPRIGETYVQFIHPKQSRDLRSNPEFIEVTKYAAPGNFMLGEIGRLYDVVFIETTQVKKLAANQAGYTTTGLVGAPSDQTSYANGAVKVNTNPGSGGNPLSADYTAEKGYLSAATGNTADVYESIMIGDNAFGHAIALPVELRDGGVLDFGREHALAWYAIWGLGIITDQAINKVYTN